MNTANPDCSKCGEKKTSSNTGRRRDGSFKGFCKKCEAAYRSTWNLEQLSEQQLVELRDKHLKCAARATAVLANRRKSSWNW